VSPSMRSATSAACRRPDRQHTETPLHPRSISLQKTARAQPTDSPVFRRSFARNISPSVPPSDDQPTQGPYPHFRQFESVMRPAIERTFPFHLADPTG
jgi:hypothetical protein